MGVYRNHASLQYDIQDLTFSPSSGLPLSLANVGDALHARSSARRRSPIASLPSSVSAPAVWKKSIMRSAGLFSACCTVAAVSSPSALFVSRSTHSAYGTSGRPVSSWEAAVTSVDHAAGSRYGCARCRTGCPWRRCAYRRWHARQGRWGSMKHPGVRAQFWVSEDREKKRRNRGVRTLSMPVRGMHSSWTLALTSAWSHGPIPSYSNTH